MPNWMVFLALIAAIVIVIAIASSRKGARETNLYEPLPDVEDLRKSRALKMEAWFEAEAKYYAEREAVLEALVAEARAAEGFDYLRPVLSLDGFWRVEERVIRETGYDGLTYRFSRSMMWGPPPVPPSDDEIAEGLAGLRVENLYEALAPTFLTKPEAEAYIAARLSDAGQGEIRVQMTPRFPL